MPLRRKHFDPPGGSGGVPLGLAVAEDVLARSYPDAHPQDRLWWLKRAASNLQLAVTDKPELTATTYYARWASANATLTALRFAHAKHCSALVTRMVGEDLVYLKTLDGRALIATGESLVQPSGLKVGAAVLVWIDPIDGKVCKARLVRLPEVSSLFNRVWAALRQWLGRNPS
jgi:hypothetical protein